VGLKFARIVKVWFGNKKLELRFTIGNVKFAELFVGSLTVGVTVDSATFTVGVVEFEVFVRVVTLPVKLVVEFDGVSAKTVVSISNTAITAIA